MSSYTPLSTSYSADGSTANDMGNGGYKTNLLPMLSDTLVALNSAYATLGLNSSPVAIATRPGGRLTLTSGTPVMSVSVTGAGTVYYTPYSGNYIPIYNGSLWITRVFTELTQVLAPTAGQTNYHHFDRIFDFFVFDDSGTLRLGTGPQWFDLTQRGGGAGSTAIGYTNGILTNTNSIVLRWGSTSGDLVTVPANRATYVGSMYTSNDGQTGMNFVASGFGGGKPTLYLYNVWNRVPHVMVNQDLTSNWTYGTAVWRQSNNSNNNRCFWLDALGHSQVFTDHQVFAQGISAVSSALSGIGLDGVGVIQNYGQNSLSNGLTNFASAGFGPQAGLHFVVPTEYSSAGTSTYWGGGNFNTRVQVSM